MTDLRAPAAAPDWLQPLLDRVRRPRRRELTRHRIKPPPDARRAAVLVLFGEPRVRTSCCRARRHPAQPCRPGGVPWRRRRCRRCGPGGHGAAGGRGGDRASTRPGSPRWPCCRSCSSRRRASSSRRCSRTGPSGRRARGGSGRDRGCRARAARRPRRSGEPAAVGHPSGFARSGVHRGGPAGVGLHRGLIVRAVGSRGWERPWDSPGSSIWTTHGPRRAAAGRRSRDRRRGPRT